MSEQKEPRSAARRSLGSGLVARQTAQKDRLVITDEYAAFTVVKNFAPGVRMRIFVPGRPDEDGNEVSDDLGQFLWERYSEARPFVAEREAALQAAMHLPGGPLASGSRGPDAA